MHFSVLLMRIDCRLSIDDVEGQLSGHTSFFDRLVLVHSLPERKNTNNYSKKCGQDIAARVSSLLRSIVHIMFNELASDVEGVCV